LLAAVVEWGAPPALGGSDPGRVLPVREYALPGCFRPAADFAKQVSEELHASSRPPTRISLQNKPLLFATQESIFDSRIAHTFLEGLPGELEILDLSMNRLPAEALPAMADLLRRSAFRFLDVRINSGADSMDAIRQLAEKLSGEEDIPLILAKVIWVDLGAIESLKKTGFLKERYYQAHRSYYGLFREYGEQWEMPE